MFRIYEGESVVVEGESPLTITGLDPNTDVAKGTYQAVRVDGDRESERVDIPGFKTKPIKEESVTIAPKTNNLEEDATRQLNVTLEPSNATNQDVAYTYDNEAIATDDTNGLVKGMAEVTEINRGTGEIDIVEYETIRNETDELPKGEEEVVKEGKIGYTLVTYEVTYEDGTEVSREETDREVIDPVDEIINVGTYEEPEPEPEPEPDPEEGD